MIGQTFAVIDLLAGIVLAGQFYWGWEAVKWVGFLMIGKAIYSLATSAAAQFYFDVIGWIDLAVGIIILLNWHIPWFFLVPIAKGIYSLIMIRM